MSNRTISATTRQAHRTGYELALAMLHEIEGRRNDDSLSFVCGEKSEISGHFLTYRKQPQDNLALRFLNRLRELNDTDAEEGFAAIITDALYSHVNVSYLEEVVGTGDYHLDTPSDDRRAINP